jgi:hypothetical protein
VARRPQVDGQSGPCGPGGLTFPQSLLRAIVAALLAFCVLASPAAAVLELQVKQPKYRAPELVFSGPPQMEQQVELLRALDRKPLAEIAELLELEDPGPPIRVLVVPEGAEETKLAPPWAVAYALSEIGVVVLVPSRVPAYPDGDLAEVLRHEVTHVLISRAAGNRPVPRFLHEGLAVVAARGWQLQDRTRLLMAVWPLSGKDLPALREDFAGGAGQAERAYVISAAFVRFLLEEEGESAGARILKRISEGNEFDQAFRLAIGHPLEEIQEAFWQETDIWQKWLPLVFGSTGFGLLLLVLILLAWRRRHRLDDLQRERWDAEELAAFEAIREARARYALAADDEVPPPALPPAALAESDRASRTPSGEWIN